KLPSPEQIKGKKYCKWHNAWSHLTNNYLVFRHVLQDAIESGQITFEDKKKMAVDENPFPQPLGVNMVTTGFKNKLPKFKLVIDDGEEDPRPPLSIFERIKGKEPKMDEDILCARCKGEVSENTEKPGIWDYNDEEDDRMTNIVEEINLEAERRKRGVSRNTLSKQLHREGVHEVDLLGEPSGFPFSSIYILTFS
ncbi:uncharacterized protein LOC111399958, partial [Olea europaea var. sylvestris]|uniref:uncharacterized protein LOC111399958 n=1 Tax=Olea europaea var. sylvestris TaxID=158386 RepID=UPI000C1D11AF